MKSLVEVSDACSPQDHGETHDREEEDDRQEDDQEGQEVRPRSTDRRPYGPIWRKWQVAPSTTVREGSSYDVGLCVSWGPPRERIIRSCLLSPTRRSPLSEETGSRVHLPLLYS